MDLVEGEALTVYRFSIHNTVHDRALQARAAAARKARIMMEDNGWQKVTVRLLRHKKAPSRKGVEVYEFEIMGTV